ncbi:MAG: haloacid dehalogenase type II [Dehalococcoidia bacterium]|nr:haloacid dehalogenase type II [Dehalococcoidia bacterium]
MAIRALTFDVFGTVVDWRTSVIRELEALGARLGIERDWAAITDDWRYDGYMRGTNKVRKGELPFMTADALHRRKLDALLAEHGIEGLDEAAIDHLNRAWHRLDPWPDAVAGIARLRSKFVVSTLSNGNVALLVNMAKHAGLTWDCVLSAELTGAFKPDPECYLRGARFLGLEPGEVMMVAAHKFDLLAAQKVGLHAAFVPRPTEAGPNVTVDLEPDPGFDYVATDFHDLAAQLGV